MTRNSKPDNKKHTRSSNGRPTIGFLSVYRGQSFHHLVWCGIADVARKRNVNAICFDGNYVYDPEGFNAQANILYDLIDVEQLDGLIIWHLVCNMLDPDETQQFYDRYRPLPMVGLGGRLIEGVTYIGTDNYGEMRQTIEHLIEIHGCRRIAYIKGLPNFRPHDERYRAYVDVLAKYALPFDPARVAVPHDTAEEEQPSWGRVALCRLLDEQKADFDALVTTNDRFVHELLPELQVRGIRVPDDIALVSFDDAEGSNYLTPPLTTMPVPMYEFGRQLAETLVDQLEGKRTPGGVVLLSPQLAVRQSCGCLDPKVMQVVAGPVVRRGAAEPLEVSLMEQREGIVAEMTRAAGNAAVRLAPDWAEQLLDSFVAALTTAEVGEASARFLSTLNGILRQVMAAKGDIGVWQRVLSTLRRQLLPYISNDPAGTCRDQAEDLWLQAQVMTGEVGQRAQAYQNLQAERRKRILNEIGTSLTTNFDVNALGDILTRELPRLGISRGYLSLYEDPQPYRYPQSPPQWSRLVLAYDEGNSTGSSRVELEPSGRRFPSRQLVPPGILPQREPYTLVAHALYFQDKQIGFMLLDGSQQDGDVYSALRTQISSALQGALLVQRVQEHSAELTRQQYILDTFMENVPDCVYFKDLESRITRANRAHAAKLGLSDPAEEIGKSDFDFFPEEQALARYEQEQEIIHTGQPILNLEEADGIGHWVLTTKMPLRDENGAIIGTFGISHDITEMKQAQAEMVRQERLSALGQLTATVAHEIRNPLGTVRTCVFTIGDAIERDELERVKRALQMAERNVVRCDAIIAELLDFTRDRTLQRSPTDIDAWLNGVLDEILDQGTIPESITCIRELDTNVEISVDTEHLRRAIINVVNNAVDAMQEKECCTNDNRLTVSTRAVDERLEIHVCDTGCGIPDEMLNRLFEPLVSTKSFGIGLGLPIVKGIMEQHGGGIEISCRADEGTTVTLWLPISKNEGD